VSVSRSGDGDEKPEIFMDAGLLVIAVPGYRFVLTPRECFPVLRMLRPEIATVAEQVIMSGRGVDSQGRRPIVCGVCDEAFFPKSPLQKYCSAVCSSKGNAAMKRAQQATARAVTSPAPPGDPAGEAADVEPADEDQAGA
jgi:hypothetical protein